MLIESSNKVTLFTLESTNDLLSSSFCHSAHEDSWMDEYFNDCVLHPSFPI